VTSVSWKGRRSSHAGRRAGANDYFGATNPTAIARLRWSVFFWSSL
jgi:hypothetical protein